MTGARLQVSTSTRLGAIEHRVQVDLPLTGLTVLFGASGAGKSTLVNLICGLMRPDVGRIAVGDTVFFDSARRIDVPVHARGLGVVSQDARLFPHLTVRDNLRYGLQRCRSRPHRIDEAAVVDLLGIAPLLARRPHTLSGGERQRVAIGRALLAQPALLLMDEPMASLDAARKAELLPYVERLRDELDLPILYVTHAVDEVLRLASALVLFEAGRTVASGPLTEVIEHPSASALRGGADAGALVHGRVQAHDPRHGLTTLACDGFSLRVPQVDLPAGAPVRLRIPAREVALALSRPVDVSITNRIEGVVEQVREPSGSLAGMPAAAHLEVRVRVGSGTVLAAAVTHESAERLALAPGLRCWCLLKSVALHADAMALARGRAAQAQTGHDVSAAVSPSALSAKAANDALGLPADQLPRVPRAPPQ
jgi:molybdate transport system ATP-binding protein